MIRLLLIFSMFFPLKSISETWSCVSVDPNDLKTSERPHIFIREGKNFNYLRGFKIEKENIKYCLEFASERECNSGFFEHRLAIEYESDSWIVLSELAHTHKRGFTSSVYHMYHTVPSQDHNQKFQY